ncbi:alpha/beta fold hydrolase [Cupriavidus necator]
MNQQTSKLRERSLTSGFGESSNAAVEERHVLVWGERVNLRVKIVGQGRDVLYLHPSGGLVLDDFLLDLAASYRIHAPEFPGTSPEDPYAVRQFEDLHDIVLAYEEAVRRLGLDRPIVIGQSFGGMLAAELASTFPDLFSAVVLLDPIGLWRDDMPVVNWNAIPAADMPSLLFANPDSEEARAFLALPEEPEAMSKALAARIWTLGCTGSFVWPIPDQGLAKRLHRLQAPTQIIWGREDKLVSAAYAAKFQGLISDSEVTIIDNCGHIPQVEKRAETFDAVTCFLEKVEA